MLHRNVQKLDPREQHYWIESPRQGMQLFLRYLPPLTRQTGEVRPVLYVHGATFPFLVQMKLCLETAGSSLENVLKCNVYCTSVEKFAAINTIYARYFPKDPPARIFVCIPAWPGPFDIEVDCIAVRKDPSE
jgi:2-iminobutanoate/2-iminopropanoate deaminase